MTKLLNSNQELPFATDTECQEMRAALIKSETIKPVGCYEEKTHRQQLIEQGIIDSGPCKSYCAPRKHVSNVEEGEYNPKPIQSREEYLHRLANYFCILQEILQSRINLNLILGRKEPTDPEWIF